MVRKKRASRVGKDKVIDDVKALAADAEQLVKGTAGDVGRAAEAAVTHAKQSCYELEEHALETGRRAAQRADDMVRRKPYESLGVVFVVGVLAGLFLARK